MCHNETPIFSGHPFPVWRFHFGIHLRFPNERSEILSLQIDQGRRVLPPNYVSLFFSHRGTFTQIAILEAIYNLTTLVGEIPTGYIGDRVGRRNSLLVGTTLISFTLVGIGLSSSFQALAVLYVCWSAGYNFRSGSEDAWLYDTLTDGRSEDAFANVRGRGESIALAIGAAAAITGGYLGSIDLSYPWFVASAMTAVGVLVLLTVDESETYERTDTDDLSLRRTILIVRQTPHSATFGVRAVLLRPLRGSDIPRVRVPAADLRDGRARPRGVAVTREIPSRMVLRNVQSLRCGTELLHWCDSGSSRASNVVSVAPLHRRRRADRDVFRSGARASDVPTDSGTFGRDAVVRRTVHQRPNRDDGARDRTQRDGDGEWSRRRSVSTRERDPLRRRFATVRARCGWWCARRWCNRVLLWEAPIER